MLTKRQKQILDYIKKYIKENDYAPTLEEMARHFKLSSVATVHEHIEALRAKGELKKIENHPRSIELNNKKRKTSDLIAVPLLGTIAAGGPIEAIENRETIKVPKTQLAKSGNHYALRVMGDSMLNEGIFDGDVVVIRKQPNAENGETVVALLNDNEVTLKKIFKEKNGFRLQPANPSLKPIFAKELEIQGKVVSVIRTFGKLKEKVKKNKEKVLGQYFTKPEIVKKLLDLLFSYKKYNKQIKILEPSFGTGNFIRALNKKEFYNIDGCEIDKDLTNTPSDFFNLPIKNKCDLIIGNPPFTKYNLKKSYYFKDKYLKSLAPPFSYLTKTELKKTKEKIENIFILKSLKHLKNKNSSIAFVLPISFFIKNKNKSVKNEILKNFSTIIIYQDNKVWFDRHIPCCFAIFTNITKLKNEIILIFENKQKNKEVLKMENIHEEIIPQVLFHKKNGYIKNEKGVPLQKFLDTKIVRIRKSYVKNNIAASNILDKTEIPKDKEIENYKLAIVRVGNASVGKSGLINIKNDILNDMFYVFDVQDRFKKNKQIKENICKQINKNLDYFRNVTCRVGSKSIKKEDVYNFKIMT